MGEEDERGNWSGKLDFLLSAIGYAVGLGNVWRFPYLAYKNGGASFLIPYIIMLVIAGLPLFFIELALGQFASQGPITVWGMAPFFMGIGYAMIIISAVVSVYYNMIIAYAIYYMLVSFVHMDDKLPWEDCGHDWNTVECRDEGLPDLDAFNRTNGTAYANEALWNYTYTKSCVTQLFNTSLEKYTKDPDEFPNFISAFNEHMEFSPQLDVAYFTNNRYTADNLTYDKVRWWDWFDGCKQKYVTPSQEYFENYVVQQQGNTITDLGGMGWHLFFTLLLAWFLIFGCLMKGIKTSGKVVYFTATFPYVILVVLLIRGLTLDGMEDGIDFYVVPEWSKLKEAKIWNDAATQIFYSLGVGFGGLLTMASYNKFRNNCYRDAILVALINCGTSIFAGFAIFSILGHMAHETGQEVEDVAASGPGLAFIAYPDGISRLPGSPVWAFLFFFMILTLGMDSQFAMMETVISGISDLFPRYLRKHKTPFTLICCLIGFLAGLPMCYAGGIRVLTLMNNFSGSYNLMVVALFELVCLCYIYGINNFRDDIKMMVGFRPGPYWIVNWMVLTPAAICFIIIVSAIQYERDEWAVYDGVVFPVRIEGIGWTMVGTPIAAMLLIGVIQLCRLGVKESFTPTTSWGPALDEDRTGRYAPLEHEFDNVGEQLPYHVDKKAPPPSYNGHNAYDNPAAGNGYQTERL